MKNILVLLLLVLPECIWAQSYSVKKLGAMEGLSNNNVLSIPQDKQGYLWFATEEGLNKFDGVHFISYYKDIPDKLHITGNELNCLLDDPIDSILWIGTQRAGLNAYNYSNNTFTIYKKAKVLNNKGAKFIGLHLEGPYFSPSQCGAQDPNYLKKPCPKEYNHFINISQDIVRWSIAPELEGAIEMGEELQRQHILPSIAHTDATYEEVEKANKAGYTHITHLYSAMSSVTRRNAFRHAGVVEAAYLIDDITVEIIADGIHLPKPLLQFVYKFKGPDKTALCTDAMRGAGMPDGESILGSLTNGQKVIIEDGVAKMPDRSAFAGSVATTDRLVRTMVQLAGIPLTDAIRMMTLTPARILHIDSSKGSLEAGKDADIIIFDNQINVINTISEGHVIYSK